MKAESERERERERERESQSLGRKYKSQKKTWGRRGKWRERRKRIQGQVSDWESVCVRKRERETQGGREEGREDKQTGEWV